MQIDGILLSRGNWQLQGIFFFLVFQHGGNAVEFLSKNQGGQYPTEKMESSVAISCFSLILWEMLEISRDI